MLSIIRELHAAGQLTPAQQLILLGTKPKEELYDLESDPHEIHNLANSSDHQRTLRALRKLLDDWVTETRDTGLLSRNDVP
jgi:hypothetical protein